MGKYKIKEDGNNGSVEVQPGEIIRTHKKRLRRDDKMHIPMLAVSSVHHERKIGGDIVTVTARGAVYQWKLADRDAKKMTAEIIGYTNQ